jgi:hypothetical protein
MQRSLKLEAIIRSDRQDHRSRRVTFALWPFGLPLNDLRPILVVKPWRRNKTIKAERRCRTGSTVDDNRFGVPPAPT